MPTPHQRSERTQVMHKFKQMHEDLSVRRMDASLSDDSASLDQYVPVVALKTRVILRLDTGGLKQFRGLWSGYKTPPEPGELQVYRFALRKSCIRILLKAACCHASGFFR